ncbi:MAG: class I SAM-dependent methyltransferase [Halobacteria archaeon]|nr:class I SAM-dependent methyltransferase [Halobacteria archaeon]
MIQEPASPTLFMDGEREKWNAKYADSDFGMPDHPTPALRDYIDDAPDGRALDIATGTGRNAVFLAENGYEVDAIDISDEALSAARRNAEREGVDGINWIQADVDEYIFAVDTYEVVVSSFYYNMNRFPDFKRAVAPGGYLIYRHHLRVENPSEYSGPSDNRVRLAPNDALRACLDMNVVYYTEGRRREEDGSRKSAVASVVACKTSR